MGQIIISSSESEASLFDGRGGHGAWAGRASKQAGTDKKLNLGISSPPSRCDDGSELERRMLLCSPLYVKNRVTDLDSYFRIFQ